MAGASSGDSSIVILRQPVEQMFWRLNGDLLRPGFYKFSPVLKRERVFMISRLAIYERSYCDCSECSTSCRERPGALAPGDMDHIAEYDGQKECSEEYLLAHFEACVDGPGYACKEYPDAQTIAIRPKRKADGSCVFLTSEGKCSIHLVAPFECKVTRSCEPSEGAGALKALAKANCESVDYIQLHLWLWNQQRESPGT